MKRRLPHKQWRWADRKRDKREEVLNRQRIKRRGPYGGAGGTVEACGSGTCAMQGGKHEIRQE